jgi:hypothetical protein
VAASRVHRWLAVIVGAQLLIWFASGLVMSILPIERVRGEHLVAKESARPLPARTAARLLASLPDEDAAIATMSVGMVLDHPMVAIGYLDGSRRLLDLASGRAVGIDRVFAERIARAAYKGPAVVVVRTRAVTGSTTEYRGALPAWQVAFDDADATRVYVDPATGRIAAVRTSTWRLYDFFWGLHIMDWKNHEDFNTPWLMAFAVGGLGLGLAGSILLYMRWPRRTRSRRGPY